ncbi:hypothetical protein AVEN_55514-1 [Araneus ventricosus]|uniref:Uncharacterized protein n=1 Tax=Araneus ventricosus TaxID=182803 RepID=A0A4Y2C997_ARAVE|nr:hypothetical protein AVEN_55514-1 [Araneus ventricosus]
MLSYHYLHLILRYFDVAYSFSFYKMGPRWPSGKVRASGRRVPGSKPDSTKEPPYMWPWFKKYLRLWAKRPPACVVWKLGEEVPTQVSSSNFGSRITRSILKQPSCCS